MIRLKTIIDGEESEIKIPHMSIVEIDQFGRRKKRGYDKAEVVIRPSTYERETLEIKIDYDS